MSPTCWQFEAQQARLALGELSASIDAARPEQGLVGLTLGNRAVNGQLLGVCFLPNNRKHDDGQHEVSLVDAYSRVADFVATYAQTETRPYRSQVYWRAHERSGEPSAVAALDLLISVQTDLLDSHPEVHVTSTLPASEVWRLDSSGTFAPLEVGSPQPTSLSRTDGLGCVLLRLADTDRNGSPSNGPPLSYVEMIHPTDFSELIMKMTEDNRLQTEYTLLADFLEKGVIRRARLRGVLLERSGDLEAAADWYQSLVSAELPLAT